MEEDAIVSGGGGTHDGCQAIVDDLATVRAGEAMVAACIEAGQIVGRQSEQMQNCSVQVAEMDFPFDDLIADGLVFPWTYPCLAPRSDRGPLAHFGGIDRDT